MPLNGTGGLIPLKIICLSVCPIPYLRPGAVLPALQQTVPVAGLSDRRFVGVPTGAGLCSLTLPLHQAVLHTLHLHTAVAWAAFSRTFALSSNMPPACDGALKNVWVCVMEGFG